MIVIYGKVVISMVIMRLALSEDKERLEGFLRNNSLIDFLKVSPDDEFMLLIERGQILGVTKFKRLSEECSVIESIFIVPSERGIGLGDGLLRATLNYLLLQNTEVAILISDQRTDGFYSHEELNSLKMLGEYPSYLTEYLDKSRLENSYYCQLNSFFTRKCKGSKGV